MRAAAVVLVAALAVLVVSQDPSWGSYSLLLCLRRLNEELSSHVHNVLCCGPADHQTTTYTATHAPVQVSGYLNVTAYFSPDHSVDTHVEAINNAQSTIDIGTPGFDSWIGCTSGSTCIGCNITGQRNLETFPLWGALLNAAHRGVSIRVLTNDYGTPDCQGSISPLPFFQLNNIQVAYYATTTYIHAKLMIIDGKIVSVSSGKASSGDTWVVAMRCVDDGCVCCVGSELVARELHGQPRGRCSVARRCGGSAARVRVRRVQR
jgi:phosphatidylserine/phosphatidylglycerophosphate/cardiolipin synthase-like enzyme